MACMQIVHKERVKKNIPFNSNRELLSLHFRKAFSSSHVIISHFDGRVFCIQQVLVTQFVPLIRLVLTVNVFNKMRERVWNNNHKRRKYMWIK